MQYLWIQQEIRDRKLHVRKVGTDSNPADLLTKPLSSEKIGACMQMMGFTIDCSRAVTAPALTT